MNELVRALTSDSAFAPPAHLLEGLPDELAQRRIAGAPHTVYAELWHIAFWQQISLDWATGVATPYPVHASQGFPGSGAASSEPWDALRARFFHTLEQAAALTRDPRRLAHAAFCPSVPGLPSRTMTVHDQLLSLAAHNAYHFGRIVLLRQMLDAWPPPSGGFTW